MTKTGISQRPRKPRINLPVLKGARLEYIGPPPLEGQLAEFHPHFWKGFKVLEIGADAASMSPDYIRVCMHSTPIDATFPHNDSWQVLKRADWRVIGYERCPASPLYIEAFKIGARLVYQGAMSTVFGSQRIYPRDYADFVISHARERKRGKVREQPGSIQAWVTCRGLRPPFKEHLFYDVLTLTDWRVLPN